MLSVGLVFFVLRFSCGILDIDLLLIVTRPRGRAHTHLVGVGRSENKKPCGVVFFCDWPLSRKFVVTQWPCLCFSTGFY